MSQQYFEADLLNPGFTVGGTRLLDLLVKFQAWAIRLNPAKQGLKIMEDIYEDWRDAALGIEFPPTSHEEAFARATRVIDAAGAAPVADTSQPPELVASALDHRACCGVEHDPANGKLHGYCVVCGVPWPCDTAKKFLATAQTRQVITFDELVEFGKNNGGNIVDGMPWSFQYKGHPITHENKNCYLIPIRVTTGYPSAKFMRGDYLVTETDGSLVVCKSALASPARQPQPAARPVAQISVDISLEQAVGAIEQMILLADFDVRQISQRHGDILRKSTDAIHRELKVIDVSTECFSGKHDDCDDADCQCNCKRHALASPVAQPPQTLAEAPEKLRTIALDLSIARPPYQFYPKALREIADAIERLAAPVAAQGQTQPRDEYSIGAFSETPSAEDWLNSQADKGFELVSFNDGYESSVGYGITLVTRRTLNRTPACAPLEGEQECSVCDKPDSDLVHHHKLLSTYHKFQPALEGEQK